jgi:hypothetical protein
MSGTAVVDPADNPSSSIKVAIDLRKLWVIGVQPKFETASTYM